MAPSFLTFFDLGQIEAAMAFLSTIVVHTLCLEQLIGYTHYSSLCTSLCTPATGSGNSFHCYILVRTPIAQMFG
jgi:hypothetical protein